MTAEYMHSSSCVTTVSILRFDHQNVDVSTPLIKPQGLAHGHCPCCIADYLLPYLTLPPKLTVDHSLTQLVSLKVCLPCERGTAGAALHYDYLTGVGFVSRKDGGVANYLK